MRTISSRQYEALDADVRRRWIERLSEWLRRHAAPCRGFTDPALREFILQQTERADRFGVRSEKALAKWCFMSAVTGGTFDQLAPVRDFMREKGAESPDERIDLLMAAFAKAAERKEAGGS